MRTKGAKFFASRNVPHLERAIVAAGQGHCAVGRECDRIDGAEMSIERADQSITAKVQSRYDSTSDHAEGNCSAQAEEEPASGRHAFYFLDPPRALISARLPCGRACGFL